MKRFVLLVTLLHCFAVVLPARAHPADMYSHSIRVQFADEGLTVTWGLKTGPMLSAWVWNQADLNQDQVVTDDEAMAWGQSQATLLKVTLDGRIIPLTVTAVEFPASVSVMQTGESYPVITLTAAWPEGMANESQLLIQNTLDETNSLNWFGLSALDSTAFRAPEQTSSRLTLTLIRDRTASIETSGLLTTWDSTTPAIDSNLPEGVTPEPAVTSPSTQEILLDLVKREDFSLSFYLLALGIALVLGALHALTPGHGKTVVAAYLVGARGTTRHAVVLGSVVTLTHTGSVLLLGVITLAASQYILPTSLLPALEVLSGLLIVGLGLYLLGQRIRDWRRSRAHQHAHEHELPHEHHHHEDDHHHDQHHEHGHEHSHEVPDTLTWRSLIALGVSGGLVPCPDAIAILLVAIAINRLMLGLALIVSFSLGLAVVLISIGLAMVHSRRLFERMDAFTKVAPAMPVVSALIVLILGLTLTYNSAVRAMDGFQFARLMSMERASIIYLADGSNGRKQLFLADSDAQNSNQLTDAPLGVVDYALSPDQNQIVYFVQTEDFFNDIWLFNLDDSSNRKLSSCDSAMCRQPAWSPDGQRLLYEHMDLTGGDALGGMPTLWLLDVESGASNPVFQSSNLPVRNARWSPDGNWLSYSTSEGVRLQNLETDESRLIENRIGAAASWSPDGAFLILRDGVNADNGMVTQLFRYEMSTQTLSPLAPDPERESILAVISPDGEWIAVLRRLIANTSQYEIWLVRADGTDARMLTRVTDGIYTVLVWSSDGNYLLCDFFLLNSDSFQTRLQRIDVNSGETTDLGLGSYPVWLWRELP